MLAWLRDLTSRERRTMLACWGGWTLDGFDQQLYSYVVPTVIAVWGMSTGAAGTIGTVTVVTSSFGGWFAGALADRFGRVRVLQIAILWYSVFTFLCAFAQNFEQLFILRPAPRRDRQSARLFKVGGAGTPLVKRVPIDAKERFRALQACL
jgi:MFS family permease